METGESGADAPDAPGAHTFVPEDELNFLAIISVSNEWPRAGKAIAIDQTPAQDRDHCTDEECNLGDYPEPGLQHAAMTASEFVRWEDGGAGGQCGKIVNDDFVEEPNHQLVTHSKTPSTPGIGTLKAFWDDPLPQQFEDPQTHQMVTMADNDEAFKQRQITVWEFTTGPPMDDRSRLDQEQTFTLELTPAADQYQQPLASWMLVWLTGVSKEPGHCLNRARDDGEEWLRTTETDVDIKIAPEQAEWWIWASEQGTTNYDQAVTNLPATSASLTVRCLDYGAVGWVEAYLMSPPSGNPEDASARRAGTTPQEQKYHVPWPLDENGTDIQDGWAADGDPDDDDDPEPANSWPRPGDNLSRHEEYRGLRMGGQWQDTDPDIDEIFIYKVYDVDCSVFKSLNPSIHYVCIGEFGFFSWAEPELRDNDTDGRVDEDPRNGVDDEDDGLVDEDPSEAPWPDLFRLTGVDRFSTRHPSTNLAHVIAVGYWYVRKTAGRTFSRLPSQPGMCTINPERIRPKTNPTHDQTTVDGRDPSAFRWVKGNELGNGVNINDHSDVPTPPEHDCVMWDDDDPDSNRQNQDPMPDGYGTANPGCALLWYLRLQRLCTVETL